MDRLRFQMRSHHFFWLGATLSLLLICAVVYIFASIQGDANRFPAALPTPTQETQSDQQNDTSAAISKPDAETICFQGCPIGSPKTNLRVRHHILTLSNNPNTKFADWVSYTITSATIGSHCQRRWMQDPNIPADQTLDPADYRDARKALETDRGHQAPLASLCGSPNWQEADYLSNITPQKTALNEGAWERLEQAERNLLRHNYSAVHSVTGPLYERTMPGLPNAHLSHSVPSAYWKLIAVQSSQNVRVAAFIMDQDSSRDDPYCSKASTVSEVERKTGLRFPTAIEADGNQTLLPDLGC